MAVEVYGSSDDLIEIEGDVNEEFNVWSTHDVVQVLAFSDGTVLRIRLADDDVWRIEMIQHSSAGHDLVITQAPEGDPYNASDRAVLSGDIRWVVLGTEYALADVGAVTG